ncbi:carbohydrate ABC transporter permease [Propionibacteriaceae bacterium Y2011]|uniref:carbohydrate ABC transporter permease n=1 Tax=Microlunatus sp. Y2014 TaxID=3418488 RepID=UPI003B48F44E
MSTRTESDPEVRRRRRRRLIHGVPAAGPIEQLLKVVVLAIFCLAVLIPFLGVLSTSIAPARQVQQAGGLVLIPEGVQFDSYKALFAGGVVTQALLVSAVVTIGGTLLSLTASCLMAYALAQRSFPLAKPILMIVLIGMLFSPGMIPMYLTVKQFGLLNSLWALIIPTMVSGFNVIVLRTFFTNLPDQVTESARIDGANDWQIFGFIVLPLSKAVLAVIGLFYAVGYWNAFFNALLYIDDQSKWPLQLVLRTYVVDDTQIGASELGATSSELVPPQASIQMAILVVSVVPILCVYPFLQRHFAKGVLTGAVKG